MPELYTPGDHLAASSLIYSHHGIYAGNNTVIHYQENDKIITDTSFDNFSEGWIVNNRFISKIVHPNQKYRTFEVVQRAKSRIGESDYNLISNNCEHFCNWCIEGKETSEQVFWGFESLAISVLKIIFKSITKFPKLSVFNSILLSLPLQQLPSHISKVINELPNALILVGAYVVEVLPLIKAYINDDINSEIFIEKIAGKTTSFFSGVFFGTVSQILIPIPVLGYIIGSLIGHNLATMVYNTLVGASKRAQLAHENYIRIKEEQENVRKIVEHNRKNLELSFNKYFYELKDTLSNCLTEMENSIGRNDLDNFSKAANLFCARFGKTPQFSSYDEYKAFRNSGKPLEL
jgi:hypothetical protein